MHVQYGKPIGIGIAFGVVGGIVASGFTVVSIVCCVANLVGYFGPALTGVVAAIAGAAVQSTAETEPGQEALQGAVAGTVAAAAGALTCAVIFGLMQFLNPVLTALFALLGDDPMGGLLSVVATSIWAAVVAVGVGVVSSVGGIVGGALAGGVVGAMKGANRS